MTLNLLSPAHADWERRRPVLRDGLAALRPDLVALQETVWGRGYDQAADLLGPGYHLARHSRRTEDGVGAVLASRWPLGAVSEIDLHVSGRADPPLPAAVIAEVEVPAGPLFFVHHRPAQRRGQDAEREAQAVLCARIVEERFAGRRPHTILAGDFGDTPDSASVRFWTGRQAAHGFSVTYQDTWEAAHPGDIGRRVEYVMVRDGTLDVADCRPAVDAVWAAGHFGVVADLLVREG
ncbi:endonuclease/exonuclease/phosphatase family metal-dependent hydrolase [Actinoplanes lutulentus]|uniref:Endonuclease/exonuclease/phosphatase family metal-dependent hydrolase n=1 Tax=Actinoplanes lutulentus TaxID=1287878 RepID=A0A327YWK8_9ACTN|nr:endonuclease/exonuclease/phosphatase family protein [Actinoplanes lutulentus]MBB2943160.1 endonuclease/exonuclease/phosphatase family metal-dependent hydrolase [Actinoplanes lutulentus]RAK25545.1 endonuclease/exonuclease/phosphatase family metal-dependent hydrolase [Actinoplanes lutulentus]